jgi:hypothetical protein
MNRILLIGAVLCTTKFVHASNHNWGGKRSPMRDTTAFMFRITGDLFIRAGKGLHHMSDLIKNKD